MTYTKRIKIIDYFVVVIYVAYLWTSLFAFIILIDKNGSSSDVKFWVFNLFIAAFLWFPYVIFHEIIKKYSAHQILEKIKWHNVRKIKSFEITITIGLGLLLIPITFFIFSIFFIPSIVPNLSVLVDISIIIGIGFIMIGACINPKNDKKNYGQRPFTASAPPVPRSKPEDSRIKYGYIGILLLNWIVLIPLSAVIFRFLLKMSWFLIIIIVILWALLSVFYLIYIERRNQRISK